MKVTITGRLTFHVQSLSGRTPEGHTVDLTAWSGNGQCSCAHFRCTLEPLVKKLFPFERGPMNALACWHIRACKTFWTNVFIYGVVKEEREKQDAQNPYQGARLAYLELHPVCERCQKEESGQIHHSHGRLGDLLLDDSKFIALCPGCHEWVHRNPAKAREETAGGKPLLAPLGKWNKGEP